GGWYQKAECERGHRRLVNCPNPYGQRSRERPALTVGLLTRWSHGRLHCARRSLVSKTSERSQAPRSKRTPPPHRPTMAHENSKPEIAGPQTRLPQLKSPARFRSFRENRRTPKSTRTARSKRKMEADGQP